MPILTVSVWGQNRANVQLTVRPRCPSVPKTTHRFLVQQAGLICEPFIVPGRCGELIGKASEGRTGSLEREVEERQGTSRGSEVGLYPRCSSSLMLREHSAHEEKSQGIRLENWGRGCHPIK